MDKSLRKLYEGLSDLETDLNNEQIRAFTELEKVRAIEYIAEELSYIRTALENGNIISQGRS